MNFLLKEKAEVAKKTIEIDEVSSSESGTLMINNNYNNTNNNTTALNKNGNNSNEKEKEENKKLQQQELRLNGIVEKGVSVNTCQRIVWVFNHFVGLALKELNVKWKWQSLGITSDKDNQETRWSY